MNFEDINNIEDFKQLVLKNELFSFRVGVFNKDQFGFHAIGNFFLNFFPEKAPESKLDRAETPIGYILKDSVLLEPENFYETPNNIVRQADIIYPLEIPNSFIGKPSFWVIASQTCTVENELLSVVLPCYLKENFCVTLPELKKINSPAANYYINSIVPNKVSRFLAFPAHKDLGESHLIIDLCQFSTIKSEELKKNANKVLSMTFCGLSYFQNRLAITLFRDVKNWDDGRNLR